MLQLICSKMQRPRLSGDLIPRRRLLDLLHAGANQKLTLTSAQAGTGKTTLLAQWLDECPGPRAWLSLDEHDNDLNVFVSYLIGAVRTVFPGACERTSGLLNVPQAPSLRVLTTSLVNELNDLCIASQQAPPAQQAPAAHGDHSPSCFVLTLDDYQTITDPAIHDLLSALLQHLPRGAHLALASRRDPPFPIHQLRARHEMTELRFSDLRFTPRETEAFLQAAVGKAVSAEETALLAAKTEGWIVGLRLAALSMRVLPDDGVFSERFEGASIALIVEYLLNEVLARQSAEIQNFAMRTSILDRFCAPLCEAVAYGGGDPVPGSSSGSAVMGTEVSPNRSQEIIEWIAQANLFLVPLDDEGRWYRYHHLFRDLLRQRLRDQRGGDEIATLHARASDWFGRNSLLEEGLHHAMAAGDMDRAARLVEEHRHEAMNREQWRRLRRWLDRLPLEVVEKRAHLLLVKIWLLGISFRYDELVPILERVGAMLERDSSDLCEGPIL